MVKNAKVQKAVCVFLGAARFQQPFARPPQNHRKAVGMQQPFDSFPPPRTHPQEDRGSMPLCADGPRKGQGRAREGLKKGQGRARGGPGKAQGRPREGLRKGQGRAREGPKKGQGRTREGPGKGQGRAREGPRKGQ